MRASLAQRTPFYYGWVIVAFGFVFGAFNVGLTSWGLGVFVTPMQAELGWDRSLVFLPLLVGAIVTTPLGIFVGPWADTRNGPRILALVGVLLFGASLLYMKVAGSELGYIFIFGIVGGVGRFTVAMALVVVPKWFVRRRGPRAGDRLRGVFRGPAPLPADTAGARGIRGLARRLVYHGHRPHPARRARRLLHHPRARGRGPAPRWRQGARAPDVARRERDIPRPRRARHRRL